MKFTTTKDIKKGPVKMMIYGTSGIGKTTLAKTLKEQEGVLIISAEGGLLSLADTDISVADLAVDDGKVVDQADRIARIGEIYNWLLTDEARKRFHTVLIDSITEIAENMLELAKRNNPDKSDVFKVWGELGERMVRLIKKFRDMPHYNVVFTALEEYDKNDSGKMFYGPEFPGKKTKDAVIPLLDEVFRYTFDEKGERCLVCQPTERTKAKDRSGKLGLAEKPDLSVIFSKIRGEEVK